MNESVDKSDLRQTMQTDDNLNDDYGRMSMMDRTKITRNNKSSSKQQFQKEQLDEKT